MKTTLKTLLLGTLLAVFTAGAAEINWVTSYDQALKTAKTEKKPILALFTGSDWCGFCIRMDKQVWAKADNQKFVNKNFVMLYVDFPRSKPISAEQAAANKELSQKFKVSGFPTTVILNAEGKELDRSVGFPGANQYMTFLKKFASKK